MSICIGPFKNCPSGYLIKLALSSFEKANLFRSSSKNPYLQLCLLNKLTREYQIVIIFNDEITVTEDIKFKVSNARLHTTQKLNFYYWLSARFVYEGVGKISNTIVENKENLNFTHFVLSDRSKHSAHSLFECRIYDDYEIISPPQLLTKRITGDEFRSGDDASTGIDESRSRSSPPLRQTNNGTNKDTLLTLNAKFI